MEIAYVRSEPAEALPPPTSSSGPIGWLRENLFSGVRNTILTLLALYLLWLTIPPMIQFLFIDDSKSKIKDVVCHYSTFKILRPLWSITKSP